MDTAGYGHGVQRLHFFPTLYLSFFPLKPLFFVFLFIGLYLWAAYVLPCINSIYS